MRIKNRMYSLVIALLLYLPVTAMSAHIHNLRNDSLAEHQGEDLPHNINQLFNLSTDYSFIQIKQKTIHLGQTLHFYQQYYFNIPIWADPIIIVSKQNKVMSVHGELITHIEDDLDQALLSMTINTPLIHSYFDNLATNNRLTANKNPLKKTLYIDKNKQAHLSAYGEVSTTNSKNQTARILLFNPLTHEILSLGTNRLTQMSHVNSMTQNRTELSPLTANATPIAHFDYMAQFYYFYADFTDLSSSPNGAITQWLWEFGDGQYSTLQHPDHFYPASGSYTVNLTVTDTNNQSNIYSENVIIPNHLPYCSSESASHYYEWIAKIKINNVSFSSTGSHYSDFTSHTFTANRGEIGSIEFTPDFLNTNQTENITVWVDLNQDGDFTDPNEAIVTVSSSNAVTARFDIPATAMLGDTRMRVIMQWDSSVGPCGSFNWGEVEDYTLNIQ